MLISPDISAAQFRLFPGTRYMGSKHKIIHQLGELILQHPFQTVYDAFGGSNVVGYYFKAKGKRVISNDFMALSATMAQAIIENTYDTLSDADVTSLLSTHNQQTYITTNFQGLYFNRAECQFLDRVRGNISLLDSPYKQALALSALARACMKKRPRGIFTFVGHRYDDGRRDVRMSLQDHFLYNVQLFNQAVFDNGESCVAHNTNTEQLVPTADLVYLDPPYFTPHSDNDYVRRYHFVEGLVKNWKDLTIQSHTKTKKFKSYPSPFSHRRETYQAFQQLIEKFRHTTIAISYSSNSQPHKEELTAMLSQYKKEVVVHEIDHVYAIGNQHHKIGNNANRVKEYLFIASE